MPRVIRASLIFAAEFGIPHVPFLMAPLGRTGDVAVQASGKDACNQVSFVVNPVPRLESVTFAR